MNELRKDYMLDRWVIISVGRENRPRQFKKEEVVKEDSICYFCPKNEAMTPPEIGRIGDKNSWKQRWFPNKFPAVQPEGAFQKGKKEFLEKMNAFGYHEVLVETPDHSKQMWDLPKEEIAVVLKVYADRIKELSKKKDVKYVFIFKNHGREAGTSLIHSHTQIVTHPVMHTSIIEELKAVKKFKKCPYCKVVKDEAKSPRFVFENQNFIAICPYASRFNYEAWILPKKHIKNIGQLDDKQFLDFAEALQKILLKLKEMGASYNYFLHYSPEKENLHFHLEITPRIATWAGFEIGTGTIINSVSPESAAEFYRGK